MLVSEYAEPKGPHPGFAHLLPFASLTGEGDNLTKLSPSPVLRSHGEAGWERVPEWSAVCKQTAEVRAGGSRYWCRKMLNQRALIRASPTFSHSLRSRAKAIISQSCCPYPPKWRGEVVARGTKPFSPDSSALPRARTFNHRLLKERAICVNSTMRN